VDEKWQVYISSLLRDAEDAVGFMTFRCTYASLVSSTIVLVLKLKGCNYEVTATKTKFVRFEVFTAVTMKNSVF
jgi:hypothetical protein